MIMAEMNHRVPFRLKNWLPVERKPAAWKPRNSQTLFTTMASTCCTV